VKAALDGRESDIDHRAVDERHAGPENGRSEDPGISRLVRKAGTRGADYCFIARRFHRLIDDASLASSVKISEGERGRVPQ
jgi:hypothetical protein